MLPITHSESFDIGRDRSETSIIMAGAFAIGGPSWTGERYNTKPSKGGIKGPPVENPTSLAVEAFFYNLDDLRLFTSMTEVPVVSGDHEWISPGNQDIDIGDIYTSVDDPGIKFQITTNQFNGFHRYGLAERIN